ncbi:hypothetical protein [Streptomyces xiamenensis]|uniref:hypothetical protein n=1 Tax=Streptomyces xiamenensis TaxID=408015 RepID=UPI0034499B77
MTFETPTIVPKIGELARDSRLDRVGVVMDHVGPSYQLRPVGGGREWDVLPEDLRAADSGDLLRAKVEERNHHSRKRT